MKPRRKTWLTLFIIIALAALAVLIDLPKGPNIDLNIFGNDLKRDIKVHLGLDLQGGTHLVYEADLSRVETDSYSDAMEGVRDVIERRVNAIGVSEPLVQTNYTEGNYRIIIELAGVHDINQAIDMIGQTPSLDFRELAEEQPDIPDIQLEGEGEDARLVDSEGNEIDLEEYQALQKQTFVMTELTGTQLDGSNVQFDQETGQPLITLQFDSEGKDLFGEITERNVGKPLAIYLDNEMISSPTVQEAIKQGDAVITGQFTVDEAKDLSRRLNAGALPVPITLISQQTVGPSLGQVSVEKSFLAGIIGLLLVALYMIAVYRLPGVLAVVALGIYGLLILALFKMIPVTMTLAGVAGFILSIGMAVDANVLIFERIKEELRKGKGLGLAIDDGFKYAWVTIRDSNLSTLITCLILGWFGTSLVKGFAITLGIGVLISMFSAVFITKTLLKLFDTKMVKEKLWLFGVKKQ